MKARLFIIAATSLIAVSSYANEKKPLIERLRSGEIKLDSTLNKGTLNLDSATIKRLPDGSFEAQGMLRGTLLDNRPNATGFMQNGTKYYIRNFYPDVDPKPVKEGSMIYFAK
jgi:hypothetical protein